MLKKYDGTNWNTASYGKYFSGTEQFTNFPLVIRPLDQSVQAYTIKGNTSVSGTPSPQNPVTISGVGEETANLLNPEGNWTDFNCTHSVSGGDITITGLWFSYLAFTAKPNTTYSMAYNNVLNQHVAVYKNEVYGNPLATTYTDFIKFTTDTDTQLYIVFYANSGGTERTVEYKNVRLYEGDYTSQTIPDYEPYGKYKISILKDSQALTPIYLGDVQTTRKVEKIIFTGEENWANAGSGANQYYQYTLGMYGYAITGASLSSHFQNAQISTSTTDVGVRVYNSSTVNISALNIRPENVTTDLNTPTKFKQWLAAQYASGTPVIVYYVRTNAITSTVNEPLMKIDEYADSIDSTQSGVTIPTTGGTTTIDVDTIVKPSEMSLTYNGKHLNKSKKYNGNNWI